MWNLCFLCFIVIQESNSLKSFSKGSSASLNNIIDQITNNIKSNGKDIGLDSVPLHDIYKEINKSSGKPQVFNLRNGVIYNLTSIERYGNSSISYNSKILNANLGFHFTGLQISYDFDIHIWNLNPTGNLKGRINDFRIYTEGNFDLNNFNATLNKLEIPTTGNIDFSVNTAVPIYGYLIQDLLAAMTLFQDIIIYEIGKSLTEKINEILKNITTLNAAGFNIVLN